MGQYNQHVQSYFVKEQALNNKRKVDFLEQAKILHEAFYEQPADPKRLFKYMNLGSLNAIADSFYVDPVIVERFQRRYGYWGREQWVIALFRDLKFWINLRDRFISYGVLNGDWDNILVNYMLSLLKPGDHVVDVGANIGVYALQAAKAVGSTGHVTAIEPISSVAKHLEMSIQENGFADFCTVYPVGLSDVDALGRMVLCGDDTNPGASYVTTDTTVGQYDIELKALDSLGLQRLDFIKIDAQGKELDVLRGGRQAIERFQPIILMELNEYSLRELGHSSLHDVVHFFHELNYSMVISPESHDPKVLSLETLPEYEGKFNSMIIVARHR